MTRLGTALLVVIATLLVLPAQAAENPKLAELDTSLNRVPDDVAFYFGKFRGGEQIKMIVNSRAWAKLVESPAAKLALKTYEMQKEDTSTPVGKIAMMLEDAQIQDMLALLADMFDDEAFIYADQSFVKSLSFLQKIQRFSQREFGHIEKEYKNAHKLLREFEQGQEVQNVEARQKMLQQLREIQHKIEIGRTGRMFQFAAQNLDTFKVPTIIFGSKLDDTKRAELNLGKLEFFVSIGLMGLASQEPGIDLSGIQLSRQKINGGNFLVVTLSGKMIPWEQDRHLMEIVKNDENAQKVIEKIKNENLVIAMGVQGDYLLVSVGSSLDELKKFGQGTPLVSRSEITRIEPYADKRFTEIAYWSKELTTLNFAYKKDADLALKYMLKKLDKTELPQEEKGTIRADLRKVSKEVKSILPEPGAVSSVAYMTATGQEQYVFSWATGGPTEKPLELLNHLGGSPILGIVVSCPFDVEKYDMMAGWVNTAWGYFGKYGLPQMPEAKQAKIKEAVDLFGPIVADLNKTTREKFLPAFGGEFAIQLDTELTLSTIPEVNQPMPMVEPAIILSVKDPKLMDDALKSYGKTIGDALAIVKMAKVKLPELATIKGDAGTRYVFSLPAKCSVHTEIKPTVGLGKETLVFAATPEAAERLMKKTPLTYGGVLTDAKKPRVMAGCFAWKNLLTSARPWIMFAVEESLKERLEECPLTPNEIRSQAETILDVLLVIRKITFESYRDGKVTIQHSQIEVKDID